MMSAQERNVSFVQGLLQAYGRSEFQTVLDALAEDVEWFVPGPPEIPYAGLYQGKGRVAEFFGALADAIEVQSFEPEDFLASWDKVEVAGRFAGRVKETGRAFHEQWVMEFRLAGGKIARFHEYMDSASLSAAFRGARKPALAF